MARNLYLLQTRRERRRAQTGEPTRETPQCIEVARPGAKNLFATLRRFSAFHVYSARGSARRPEKKNSDMRYRFLRNFAIACAVLVFSLVATRLCVAAPAGVLEKNHPAVQAVISVKNEITPQLLERAEVLGTAVGVDTSGNPLLSVYINRDSPSAGATLASLPREIHGVAVRGELMEEIRAMGYTGKQTPPISLGTSGGWKYDSANGYCCSGRLVGV